MTFSSSPVANLSDTVVQHSVYCPAPYSYKCRGIEPLSLRPTDRVFGRTSKSWVGDNNASDVNIRQMKRRMTLEFEIFFFRSFRPHISSFFFNRPLSLRFRFRPYFKYGQSPILFGCNRSLNSSQNWSRSRKDVYFFLTPNTFAFFVSRKQDRNGSSRSPCAILFCVFWSRASFEKNSDNNFSDVSNRI